jgi:hypothetical protein
MNRKKIVKDLDAGKEYVEDSGRIYFKTLNGYIASLPKNYYFERLHRLQDYFRDREPSQAQKLIKENIGIGAIPLEEDLSQMKTEKVYESCFCEVWKFSNYPPSWDGRDVDPRRTRSPSMRESDDWNTDPWRTERNDWVTDFALKIRDKLREGLKI